MPLTFPVRRKLSCKSISWGRPPAPSRGALDQGVRVPPRRRWRVSAKSERCCFHCPVIGAEKKGWRGECAERLVVASVGEVFAAPWQSDGSTHPKASMMFNDGQCHVVAIVRDGVPPRQAGDGCRQARCIGRRGYTQWVTLCRPRWIFIRRYAVGLQGGDSGGRASANVLYPIQRNRVQAPFLHTAGRELGWRRVVTRIIASLHCVSVRSAWSASSAMRLAARTVL